MEAVEASPQVSAPKGSVPTSPDDPQSDASSPPSVKGSILAQKVEEANTMTDTDLVLWDQKRSRELSLNMHRKLCPELRGMIYDNFYRMHEGNHAWDVGLLPGGILSLDENHGESWQCYHSEALPTSQQDMDRLRATTQDPYSCRLCNDDPIEGPHPVPFSLDNHRLFNNEQNVYWHERYVGADVAREFAEHWYRNSIFVIKHTTALFTFLEQDLFSGHNTDGRFFPASENPEHRLIPRQHMTGIRVHIHDTEWADPESLEGLSQRLRQLSGLRETAVITIVFVVQIGIQARRARAFFSDVQLDILELLPGFNVDYRRSIGVQVAQIAQYGLSMIRTRGRVGLILLAPVWRELRASGKRLRFII